MEEPRKNFYDDGVEVDMGFGKTLRFYPLTWGAQRRLRDSWGKVFGDDKAPPASDAWQDAVADILFASVSRGDPAFKREDLFELLDGRNAAACFRALAAASGMKRQDAEEASDGPRPTMSPNGADSTQPLSPPQVGPSPSAMN